MSQEIKGSTDKQLLEEMPSRSLGLNSLEIPASNIFGGGKSSFEVVNNLGSELKYSYDSENVHHNDYRNSLDILASNINKGPQRSAPIKDIIQIYNQKKNKIEHQALEIGQVQSESEEAPNQIKQQQQDYPASKFEVYQSIYPQSQNLLQTIFAQEKFNYHSYFPQDLADVLKERQIPLEYVRGMLMARDQKEIKTTRRLKVQRYLQKRRKKTWNRKICYNCRQKVAEERLRIKGKFIKKRHAMEILGLTIPIDTALLKQKLEAVLNGKEKSEVMKLLSLKGKHKDENESDSSSESSDAKKEQSAIDQEENESGSK